MTEKLTKALLYEDNGLPGVATEYNEVPDDISNIVLVTQERVRELQDSPGLIEKDYPHIVESLLNRRRIRNNNK